jgi:hypothetical protein
MRISQKLSAMTVAVALAGAVASSASGGVLRPWWHLTSGARPTYLHSGMAQKEVQEIVTTPGVFGGNSVTNFFLSVNRKSLKNGEFATEPVAKEFNLPLLTAGNLQSALRADYPGDSWSVEEKLIEHPATAGEMRFVITSDGPAATIEAHPEVGTAKSKVVSEGRADGEIVVFAENLGDANASGVVTPVRITDALPAHMRAVGVAASHPEGSENTVTPLPCSLESGSHVSCTFEANEDPGGKIVPSIVTPYEQIEVRIAVRVEPGAVSGEENAVSVSGGGAPEVSLKRPLTISSATVPFGLEDYELVNEEVGGAPDTQAGSHPFQQTTTIDLNQLADTRPLDFETHKSKVNPPALAKDLSFKWPPGLIGNPTSVARCTLAQFLKAGKEYGNECPPQSAVGVASVTVNEPDIIGTATFTQPLFNLEPLNGEPARFAFDITLANVQVYIDPSLRSGSDYGITVSSYNITQTAAFLSTRITVWGVPGAPEHDAVRGWGCLIETELRGAQKGLCAPPSEEQHPAAFLSLPTLCTGPFVSTGSGDSWTGAGQRAEEHLPPLFEPLAGSEQPALVGCNRLPFGPAIKVSPDGQQASKPTGLNVDVHVPQEGQLNGAGLAQSSIRNIQVTLPEGVTLNPSAADGLQACSEQLIGYEPEHSSSPSELHFTPRLPGSIDPFASGAVEPLRPGVNFCPDSAKIATVKVKTPLLPNPLEGAVYLASPQNFSVFPQENPFETHVAMYVVAEDPVSGSLVKLPGRVELGGAPGVEGLAPGQIRSTFENTPPVAFEDAELHFFGGERAPLASPSRCGTYTTNATYTPWSGGPSVHSSASFQVTSGPNGTPCPGASLPFAASLSSGATNNNAGSFSDLTTTLSRPDGDQSIQSVTLHYPPGLSGLLSGVKLCGEAQANAGACGPESQIGETIVSVGVGGDPFTVTGGKVYITEKYAGAPFGLSIVNPAKAGPFDLQEGRPVVVRAKINVDPITAALTITTDPPGSQHAIPTIIEGFPLQIQHVNVLVNRPGFTFNPTSCNKTEITGVIDSAEGASSPVSVPFQATNCAVLGFKPAFKVSTSGNTSRASGASLTVKLTYPKAPFGSQANIKSVKVDLPKQLPSRLTTLQKACTAAQFQTNPAGCPAASIIGHATAITPLIPVPLTGPAYFVSYGGAKFPELVIALQGYGVTVDLHGETFINKAGITSSTFRTVPDAPVGSFELTLPQGKYSALAANGNLCKSKLKMPTLFTAQNGTVIKQSTPISVTGCAKHKAKHARKAGGRHKQGKKK